MTKKAEAPEAPEPAPKGNIYQRMAAAMNALEYVKKTAKVSGSGGGYTAASHDHVTAKTREVLLANGVIAFPVHYRMDSLPPESTRNGNIVQVVNLEALIRFQNIDDPADHIDIPSVAHGKDAGDKAPGKAISMAVKYALLKGLMLETGDREEERVESEPVDPPPQREAITPHSERVEEDYWVEPPAEVAEKPLFLPLEKVMGQGKDKDRPVLINGRALRNWRQWLKDYQAAMKDTTGMPEALTVLEELFDANADTEADFAKTQNGQNGGINWLDGQKERARELAAQSSNYMEAAE